MFLNESIYDILDYTDINGNKIKKKRMNIPFPVLNNKIETGEVLDTIDHVYIDGLYETGIQNEIKESSYFKVNYNTGTIFVHPSQEGKTLNLTYTAKAQIRYKAKNTVLEDLDNNFVGETVEDALKESAERINNLVLNTSNPAEVTDGHLDGVYNVTDTTLKQGLDRRSQMIKDLQDDLGDITKLNTTDNSSAVNAINENTQEIKNARKGEVNLYTKINKIDSNITTNATNITAINRMFINALNPPLPLNSCKGDGDGTAGNGTDDLSSLQAIHDYIINNFGRGTIYLPYGVYRITGTFNWDVGKVSIEGAGAVIFADFTSTSYVIATTNSNTGNPYNQNTTYMKGIKFKALNQSCNGIAFNGGTGNIGASHIAIENSDIEGFNVGVSFNENSYLINIMKTDIHNCNIGIDCPNGTSNAGEKYNFVGCVMYNNLQIGVRSNSNGGSSNGELMFIGCSFDYNVKQFEINAGRCYLNECHIEASDHTVTPITVSGSGSSFVMLGGTMVLTGNLPHTVPYIFDCTTTQYKGSGIYLNGVFANNLMTTSKKWASGTGTVIINNLMSYDTTSNPVFISDAHNKLQDGSFEQATIQDNIFIISDTQAITSKLTGANLALSRSTSYARTYSGSLNAHKTFGSGSACGFMIAVPIRNKSSIINSQLYYKKPGAETGTVYVSTGYVALTNNASGVPIIQGTVSSRSSTTINFTSTAVDWTLVSDGEPFVKVPDWATHYYILVNMDNFIGAGDLYFDDVLITEM